MKSKKNHSVSVPIMYKHLYRNYYIQQFSLLYPILMVHHKQHIHLNNQIYISDEMINANHLEYNMILKQQTVLYNMQINIIKQIMNSTWKMIDEIDHTCFPDIDFNYDHSFRNIHTLFELLKCIISNKIE